MTALHRTIEPDPESGVQRIDGSTERFRRQHEELMLLGLEITMAIKAGNVEANASAIRVLLARFSGKVVMHAKMEENAVYPRLLDHRDAAVRAQAAQLLAEVRKVYDGFADYTRRWSASAIERDPSAFVRETKDALRALGLRMQREDDELYPLAERA